MTSNYRLLNEADTNLLFDFVDRNQEVIVNAEKNANLFKPELRNKLYCHYVEYFAKFSLNNEIESLIAFSNARNKSFTYNIDYIIFKNKVFNSNFLNEFTKTLKSNVLENKRCSKIRIILNDVSREDKETINKFIENNFKIEFKKEKEKIISLVI